MSRRGSRLQAAAALRTGLVITGQVHFAASEVVKTLLLGDSKDGGVNDA